MTAAKSDRVQIALCDLHPNPFKQFVLGGRLDNAKVERLEASVRQTDFWDNLLGRRKDGHIEVAYGHKRLEAAKRVLGKDYVTSIKLADLSDAQMIQAMAQENALGETESVEAQIDVVTMAGKFLINSSAGQTNCLCGESLKAKAKDGRGRAHDPGSVRCVSGFLVIWDRNKVQDLFTLRDRLPKLIREHITERAGSTAEGRDDGTSLGRRTATTLASLATDKEDEQGKHLQEVIYQAVKTSIARVTDDDMARIVKTVKATPVHRRELVAEEEAKKVVQEIKFRSSPRLERAKGRVGKGKKKQPIDLVKHLAKQLPEMRRLDRALGAVLVMFNEAGENILLTPEFKSHSVVVDFFFTGDNVAGKLMALHKPIKKGRKALHA